MNNTKNRITSIQAHENDVRSEMGVDLIFSYLLNYLQKSKIVKEVNNIFTEKILLGNNRDDNTIHVDNLQNKM